jgi:hypothetical protein
MRKAATGLLAVILIVGLSLVVAGRVTSPAQTVYTVPQLQASLPMRRGGTVLVRGVLMSAMDPCGGINLSGKCHVGLEYALSADGIWDRPLLVIPGAQDPLLVLLRRAHAIAPLLASTGVPRIYRVQILAHAPSSCTGKVPCPRVVLLDTLR